MTIISKLPATQLLQLQLHHPSPRAIMENKAVVKLLGVNDAESQKAAKKALVKIDGISSWMLDFKKSRLVAMGDADPIFLVSKLREFVKADLETYGPVKDEGKPQNPVIVQNMAVVKLLGVNDAESQKAAKKALVKVDGISFLMLDFKKSRLVVMGDTDPIFLVSKLREFVKAELETYVLVKDEGKPQKNEGKPQKKDGGGGNVDQKPKKQL